MTPHRLHATAALESLRDARRHLADLADAEAAQIAAEASWVDDGLRSTVYGQRFGSGGHSDPTATTYLIADRPLRINRPQAILDDLDEQLERLALPLPGAGAPLDRIRAAIATATPRVLGPLTEALDTLDRAARRFLRESRPTAPLMLVGHQAECPACRARKLVVQTVGPMEAWTVVCTGEWEDGVHNPCLCLGAGCPCGVSGAVEGVAHIWWRRDVLGAVAGAAPTENNN